MKVYHLFKSFYLNTFLRIIFLLIIFILGFALLIQLVEPVTFKSTWDGIWWGIVTTFTIGYGDLIPQTIGGKIVATIFILVGTGLGSYYMASLSSQILKKQIAYSRGDLPFTEHSHLIIVGWSERSKQIIQYLHSKQPSLSIVLIDSTLTSHPMDNTYDFHFLKGDPTKDSTLIKANIAHAHTILITSDQHKSEQDADMYAILTLLAAKGVNPNIYCIVEILTHQHMLNARRSGSDVIIEANKFAIQQITIAIYKKELHQLFPAITDAISNEQLTLLPIPFNYVEKDFLSCCEALLKENLIIIGIKRDNQFILKPSLQEQLQENDQLIILN